MIENKSHILLFLYNSFKWVYINKYIIEYEWLKINPKFYYFYINKYIIEYEMIETISKSTAIIIILKII